MKKVLFIAASAAIFLTACGGGGTEPTPLPKPPVVELPAPYTVGTNSYYNLKSVQTSQISYPQDSLSPYNDAVAFTIGNFSKDKSTQDLFVAKQTYQHHLITSVDQATPSEFLFYSKNAQGGWDKKTGLVESGTTCVHPRKAAVADLNKDGQSDIVVFCHGADREPFPGERSKIVMSQPNGKYKVVDMHSDVSYYHTGALEDLNGDGWVDIMSIGKTSLLVYINNKDGTFTRSTLPALDALIESDGGVSGQYNMQIVDLNEDGKYDILLGGNEVGNPSGWMLVGTRIIYNSADGLMQAPRLAIIPPVPNWYLINDFLYVKVNGVRYLYINRNKSTDWTGYLIQKVNLDTMVSTVELMQENVRWWPWILKCVEGQKQYVCRDDARYPDKVEIK